MTEHDDRRCSIALVEVSTWSFGKRQGGCKWRQERKRKARPRQSARRPRPPRRLPAEKPGRSEKNWRRRRQPGAHHQRKPGRPRTPRSNRRRLARRHSPYPPRQRPPSPHNPLRRGERIGVVTPYYSHLSVATLRLDSGTLRVGDVIHIHGHTTDFSQTVESLEVNHAPVTEVGPNDDFGLKVIEHAREHDIVYKVRS